MTETVNAGSDASAGTYRASKCGDALTAQVTHSLPSGADCAHGAWETVSGGASVNDPYPDRWAGTAR